MAVNIPLSPPCEALEDMALNFFLKLNEPGMSDVLSPGRSISRISARTTKSRHPSRLTPSRLTPIPSRHATHINGNQRGVDSRKDIYILTWRNKAMVNAENFEWHKKKRSYWQQFAKDKVKELLKDEETLFPEREPMYTAHCGPKFRTARSSSIDSVKTDISLFSVSTVGNDKPEITKRKRKKKVKPDEDGRDAHQRKQGPGWESFAKEKKGLLDAMIKKDTGNLEGFVKGKVIDRARASDMMTEEERTLIMNCGYTTGIACKEKSASTENLFSFYTRGLPENQLSHEPRSGSEIDTRPASVRTPYKTGRTPSPRMVIQEQPRQVRPASAMPLVHLRLSEGKEEDHRRRFSKVSKVTGLKDGQQQASRRGSLFPSIDGRLLGRKADRKIQSTINALYRMTGYGDPVSLLAPQYDESNFTSRDYGRTVRYPQSIRVAPSLARVITNDIRGRVGDQGVNK